MSRDLQPAAVFLKTWQEAGYDQPTPIQQAVYASLKQGQSVLGLAATGKGKTLAFGLPLLEQLTAGGRTQLVVFEPSAELVIQVRDVLQPYTKDVGLAVQGVVGKANLKRQLTKLKQHPEVVIATPGRFLELLQKRVFKIDRITQTVIDEADLQLDQEHWPQIQPILKHLQADVQLVLMSATAPARLQDLTASLKKDFQVFDTREQDQKEIQVQHQFFLVGDRRKAEFLKQLSRGPLANEAALVFVKNRGRAKTLMQTLQFLNLKVGLLLGDESPARRQQVMQQFRRHHLTYLLTTDLAARGLDFAALSWVINYDLPTSLITYIHRAGRTGRMQHAGVVLNLGNDHDQRDLQKLIAGHYALKRVYLNDRQLTYTLPTHVHADVQGKTKRSASAKPVKHHADSAKTKTKRHKQRWRQQRNKGRRHSGK